MGVTLETVEPQGRYSTAELELAWALACALNRGHFILGPPTSTWPYDYEDDEEDL